MYTMAWNLEQLHFRKKKKILPVAIINPEFINITKYITDIVVIIL